MATREATVIVIETYDTREEAVKAMHRQARIIRAQRLTERFGVFVEERKGTHWLCLVDRHAR